MSKTFGVRVIGVRESTEAAFVEDARADMKMSTKLVLVSNCILL